MSAYITTSLVIQHHGETWFINSKGSGVYTHMMKVMLNQIEAMFSYHNKLFLLRIELRQPEYTNDSKHISEFFVRLKGFVMRKYKLKRFGYAWVREKEDAEQQHYHCFILLDGSKVQGSYFITKAMKKYWDLYYGGYSCWPDDCYYCLDRNDRAGLQDAIYRISYLAKGRGKGYKPNHANNFGCSRVKNKPEKVSLIDCREIEAMSSS